MDARLQATLDTTAEPVRAIVVIRCGAAEQHLQRMVAKAGTGRIAPRRLYHSFPAAAVTVDCQGLERPRQDPAVSAVIRDGRVHTMLEQGAALIRSKQLAMMQKIGAEHLRHHEDPLRVADILRDLVDQQSRSRRPTFGSARRAQVASPA